MLPAGSSRAPPVTLIPGRRYSLLGVRCEPSQHPPRVMAAAAQAFERCPARSHKATPPSIVCALASCA